MHQSGGVRRIGKTAGAAAQGTAVWWAGWLVALVILGSFLRFHDVERNSLWADELFTVNVALHHPLVPESGQRWLRKTSVHDMREGDTFLSVKAGEQSPPLFDLLEKASVQALGPTEFAARLPAALAACALLVWVAAHAWRARGTWLGCVLAWSLLLLALHPGLILYAKEARAYSLGASLIGMGFVLWLQRWQHGPARWVPPGWAEIALFLAACYTHYNAAALVALVLLPDAVLATRRRSRTAWVRLATLGVVFLVWVGINARTILFTASGGVAWPRGSAAAYLESVARDVPNMLHVAWLAAAVGLAAFALVQHRLRGDRSAQHTGRWVLAIVGLVLAYAALAALIAFKAGMGHPRYYIFAVPLAMVAIGIVCAQLQGRAVAVAAAALLVGLSQAKPLPGSPLQGHEDFRSIAQAAALAADKDTLFLYPWKPNRFLYRVYLDRYLQSDSGPRLVPVSQAAEAAEVCARLAKASNVTVLAHASQPDSINAVYAECGQRWPQRERRSFAGTFVEHWRPAP